MFIPEVEDTKETLSSIIQMIEESVFLPISVLKFETLIMAVSEPDMQLVKQTIMDCFRWMLTSEKF